MPLIYKFNQLSNLHKASLIIILFLVTASIIIAILRYSKPQKDWSSLIKRIRSWWIMVLIFLGAVAVHKSISLIFFCLMSFWAFKEYITLIETRKYDHRALLIAFLAILINFYWIYTQWYGMFIIFIPVYIFLFLPLILVLAKEPAGFLGSATKIQWGLMAFVYGLSHIAYLINLPGIKNSTASGKSLVLFLVILTEMNDIFQFLWGKFIGGLKIVPTISPNKTWAGFLGGIASTAALSICFKFLTPFTISVSIILGASIAVFGFIGDVVISALKRDIGVKDSGTLLPGHGGMLDRIDSLCYSAPLFFHIVRYFYY